MRPSHFSSARLGLALLLAAPAIAACGKTVPPPAEPPIARRSADEIILAARLSPDVAPKAAFEIHRLDAFAACSAAQARFEGQARFKAQSSGGASGGILGGIVIGGLGLVGGVVTTALAAGLEAPAAQVPTPEVPNPEPPDVDGKTGVIVAGVLTGVVVVGAAVITVVLLAGGDDDDDEEKKRRNLPPILVPVTSATGGLGAPAGGAVGQLGGALGQAGGAAGQVGGALGGLAGQAGVNAGGQVGVGGVGVGGQAGLGGQGGGTISVQPVSSRADVTARVQAFQGECPDDPAPGALPACTDKARILRLSCSGGR
jgi:hypothetical protein